MGPAGSLPTPGLQGGAGVLTVLGEDHTRALSSRREPVIPETRHRTQNAGSIPAGHLPPQQCQRGAPVTCSSRADPEARELEGEEAAVA